MEFHADQKSKISTDMYLKEIYLFKEQNKKNPKAVDLVKKLKLSKGTVSEMLKKLESENLIVYGSKEIKLSQKGDTQATNIVRKYLVIKKFLKEVLKLSENKLHDEACNLEHAFSDEAVEKIDLINKSKKI